MISIAVFLIAIVFAFIGTACFATCQKQNWAKIGSGKLTLRQVTGFKGCGLAALTVSCALLFPHHGASFSFMLLVFLFAMSAFIMAMLLAYSPNALSRVVEKLTVRPDY